MLLLESSESSENVLMDNSVFVVLVKDGDTESTKVSDGEKNIGAIAPPRCSWFTSLDRADAAPPLGTRKTVATSPPLPDPRRF